MGFLLCQANLFVASLHNVGMCCQPWISFKHSVHNYWYMFHAPYNVGTGCLRMQWSTLLVVYQCQYLSIKASQHLCKHTSMHATNDVDYLPDQALWFFSLSWAGGTGVNGRKNTIGKHCLLKASGRQSGSFWHWRTLVWIQSTLLLLNIYFPTA